MQRWKVLSSPIVWLPWIESPQLKLTSPRNDMKKLMTTTWITNFIIFWLLHPEAGGNFKTASTFILWKPSFFPYLTWYGDPQGIPWIIYDTWPVLHIYSKGRLQTLPKVQWTRGLSSAYQGSFFRLYNKINMSTKHQYLS